MIDEKFISKKSIKVRSDAIEELAKVAIKLISKNCMVRIAENREMIACKYCYGMTKLNEYKGSVKFPHKKNCLYAKANRLYKILESLD